MQRYEYYVRRGIPLSDLAPMPQETLPNVHSRLSARLMSRKWQELRKELHSEIEKDYQHSLQKGIVDYVLKDPLEKQRLKILSVPLEAPHRTIRAPVPWHSSLQQAREAQGVQLFITSQVMLDLQTLWRDK